MLRRPGPRGVARGPVVSAVAGEGPDLILLHGLAGSGKWWRRNIPTLARMFRVTAIDLPGFGSSHRTAQFVLEKVPSEVAATMDRLGIERAHVVGHSMGGLVAGGLAADHPDRVNGLVLVDAGFLSLDPSLWHRLTGPIAALRWIDLALVPIVVADSLRSGPIRMASTTMQLLQADWSAKLPRIQASTLVLWGEHDTICPPRIGREIAARVPGSRLVVIDGAAHNPMWEKPHDFNREVVAFLAPGS